MAEALCTVGQEFTQLDHPDPRMDGAQYVYRLGALFKAWDDEDPAPLQVWPINLTILQSLAQQLQDHPDPSRAETIMDLCIIGFFFLCCPGEYALSPASDHGRSKPFRLCNTTFSNATIQHAPATECSLNDVQAGVYISLTYTNQKNATHGEAFRHGLSGDPVLCPIHGGQQCILHLHDHGAPPETPLYTYYDNPSRPCHITTTGITHDLLATAATVQHITNIPPNQIEGYGLHLMQAPRQ